MRHSKPKRADLSLSTNAIVVLILAITILGLGLTFVRGLFKQAESKITEVTSSTELANPPTRDNPMTTSPGQLTIRKNEVGKVLVAYLNTGTQGGSISPRARCKLTVIGPTPSTSAIGLFTVSGTTVDIDQDKINVWTVAFNPTSTGTALYTFTMGTGATEPCNPQSKDVIVTVTA